MKPQTKFEIVMYTLIALLIAWAILNSMYGCDSTKGHDFQGHDTPEPTMFLDKTIQYEGQFKIGTTMKLWVDMPPEFNFRKRFHFSQYSYSYHKTVDDTIHYKFKHKGEITISVSAFNVNSTQVLPSYVLKKTVR